MSEGRMRCCGTSLFLKKRFGAGYILNIAKANNDCVVSEVTSLVKSHVSEAELTSAVAGEIVYQLPVTSVGSFGALFSSLRDGCRQLKIGAYGVSITTLEQVFIRLAREAQRKGNVTDDDDVRTPVYLFDIIVKGYEIMLSAYSWTKSRIFPNPMAVAEPTSDNKTPVGGVDHSPHPQVVMPAIAWGTPVASVDVKGDVELGQNHTLDIQNVNVAGTGQKRESPFSVINNNENIVNAVEEEEKKGGDYEYHHIATNDMNHNTNKEVEQHQHQNNQVEVSKGIATTHASVLVQLQELLRKRLIIASRDLKGLFFQILFPALQILLVLMILTVNLSPAGRSLTLRASTISNSADVLYSGNLTAIPWGKWLPIAARLKKTKATNSSGLSE